LRLPKSQIESRWIPLFQLGRQSARESWFDGGRIRLR
jgi:hypothetical protein